MLRPHLCPSGAALQGWLNLLAESVDDPLSATLEDWPSAEAVETA
jgi:hypothetical protein